MSALVVLWRLRYKLSLRDLTEMFQVRGFGFSYEAVRDWEAKLTPALAQELRRRRKGKVGPSWYIDETYIQVRGSWKYLYRAIDRDGVLVDVMLSEHRNPDNNRIEQDHRGIKSRCRPMLGFKSTVSAKRYCQGHGELRNFLRCRSRMCQYIPAATRRCHNMRRTAIALGILEAA